MLGYGNDIVGTSAIAQKIPLFAASLPHINQVPAISVNSSHEIDPEQLIALNTRLLFVAQNMAVPRPELLKQAGIRVLVFPANSLAALRQRVLSTGQVLGPDARQKAQEYEAYFANNRQRVARRLAGLAPSRQLRVYHSMGSPLITTGRPSLNQDWMDLAGARNVAEDWFNGKKSARGEVALERVVAANPQVIVAMNKRDARAILASPQWARTDAVVHHRVYVNPKGMFWWCRETSEEALQFLWLAKMLYPERFTDIDMRSETRHFYRQFFGLQLSDTQIDTILNPPQ
ncbi:hypothetical protein EB105725_13_00240 [Shimwellia blattae DSM 4481 = NBRC 105725]|nr:hypothetical protein EB105725_13_00240 [Shimwellia blattae DSM 4481 = NBRC 105725]